MNRYVPSSDEEYIFGTLLIIANRCITLMDKMLKTYDLTAMQWMLTIVLGSYVDYDPSLTEVAIEMGSSHQNVKQIALKLVEKNLVKINIDQHDSRIKRLHINRESMDFWSQIQPMAESFLKGFYHNMNQKDRSGLRTAIQQIYENLQTMEDRMIT